jgi:hypothetical protein
MKSPYCRNSCEFRRAIFIIERLVTLKKMIVAFFIGKKFEIKLKMYGEEL